MEDWKEQPIKRNTPRTFKCVRCGVEEEALPWGMDDFKGGTHFVYFLPEGWWSITTREGMKLFCSDEAVTIVGGEVVADAPH
jgi:rubredoxin